MNGKITYDCFAEAGFYPGPHSELPKTALASNTALACNGNSYLWWYTWYRFVNSIGTTLVYVRMAGEDWYNYCSAGNVYIQRTNCDTDLGYQCDGWRQGSFFDGGRNANTDWGNQQTQVTVPGSNYVVYRCFYLRWLTHPDGTWYYQDTTAQTGAGYYCY